MKLVLGTLSPIWQTMIAIQSEQTHPKSEKGKANVTGNIELRILLLALLFFIPD